MSITDHPTDPPFGAPRRPPMRVVEAPPPAIPDPVQGDIEAQLREIATAQGFRLVPAKPSDDESWPHYIAGCYRKLNWGEMKACSRGILGDDATEDDVIKHADKTFAWASKGEVAA